MRHKNQQRTRYHQYRLVYLSAAKKKYIFKIHCPMGDWNRSSSQTSIATRNLQLHDLTRGIPFKSDSVDAVYHSHFLEHIPRKKVDQFFAEVRRVLKIGGIHRIVVPGFRKPMPKLSQSLLQNAITDLTCIHLHESYISNVIEQLVRKEPFMSSVSEPHSKPR